MDKLDKKSTAIAARLRRAREQAGLSQSQVAKLLHLHRPSISEAEAGRRKVSAEELAEFARIYGVSVSWLVDEEPEMTVVDRERIQLAARELSRLKSEDLDKLLELLQTMRSGVDKSTETKGE
jgi:transcriptional regulator with XRE-family HTH domain